MLQIFLLNKCFPLENFIHQRSMVSTKILSSKTVYIYLKPLCIMHFKHILNALIVPLMHLTMHCYHIYTVYNIYIYTPLEIVMH